MNKRILLPAILAGLITAGCGENAESEPAETQVPENEVGEEAASTEAPETENASDDFEMPFDGTFTHLHGMGYIEQEDALYFSTHHGLKIFRDGNWFETSENNNDYMGFNAVDEGFYTSGHPSPDSDMPNPIGIQRSMDGGRSLEHLGMEGETDFHLMAAGYQSHHLFVMNPAPNSQIEAGFHRSEDLGETWEQVEAQGLEGEAVALAMHPTDSQLIAAATSEGVYLSEDGGQNFGLLSGEEETGTAVFFNDEELYYASYQAEPALVRYTLEGGEQTALELPELTEDAVAYISEHPEEKSKIAISTFKGHAFVSEDAAASWQQILEQGQVQQ